MRWEYFNAFINEEASTPGRWIGERSYPGETLPTWGGIGGFTPRFGAVYDTFGNGKTALKFGVNKYNRQLVDDLTNRYNPIRPQTSSVSWRDVDGDDVADGFLGCSYLTPGCEINLGQLPSSFGVVPTGCSVIATAGSIPCGTGQIDPEIHRGYSLQYNVGVQHELLPRISVNAYWFYSRFYDLARTDNVLQSFNDYTPVNIVSPLDGSIIHDGNVAATDQGAESRACRRERYAVEQGVRDASARLPGHQPLWRIGDRAPSRGDSTDDQPPAVRTTAPRRHCSVATQIKLSGDPVNHISWGRLQT